jgi:hypothetical protein
MTETPPKPKRPYQPPQVVEIVLDPDEAMLTSCVSHVVSSPPCPPPNHSVIKSR